MPKLWIDIKKVPVFEFNSRICRVKGTGKEMRGTLINYDDYD